MNHETIPNTPFNPIETYIAEGERTGKASAQGDESFVRFNREWMRKAITLEHSRNESYAEKARAAWDAAYRHGSLKARGLL